MDALTRANPTDAAVAALRAPDRDVPLWLWDTDGGLTSGDRWVDGDVVHLRTGCPDATEDLVALSAGPLGPAGASLCLECADPSVPGGEFSSSYLATIGYIALTRHHLAAAAECGTAIGSWLSAQDRAVLAGAGKLPQGGAGCDGSCPRAGSPNLRVRSHLAEAVHLAYAAVSVDTPQMSSLSGWVHVMGQELVTLRREHPTNAALLSAAQDALTWATRQRDALEAAIETELDRVGGPETLLVLVPQDAVNHWATAPSAQTSWEEALALVACVTSRVVGADGRHMLVAVDEEAGQVVHDFEVVELPARFEEMHARLILAMCAHGGVSLWEAVQAQEAARG